MDARASNRLKQLVAVSQIMIILEEISHAIDIIVKSWVFLFSEIISFQTLRKNVIHNEFFAHILCEMALFANSEMHSMYSSIFRIVLFAFSIYVQVEFQTIQKSLREHINKCHLSETLSHCANFI